MIATDPEMITTIQRVEFSSREPSLFQRVPALDRQEQMAMIECEMTNLCTEIQNESHMQIALVNLSGVQEV